MTTQHEGLDCTIDGTIAWLWIDRVARRNAFDAALVAALTARLAALADDATVRVVVLGGRGEAFCAGADLEWMAQQGTATRAANCEDALQLARLFATLDALPQPTVARVHGACFGGGVGLVAACDLALAADDARFCLAEARLGLLPATIGPFVLRAIGHRVASRYMLTAEVFDATEALRIGLVHEVVVTPELDGRVTRMLAALLAAGPRAQREIKRMLRALAGRPASEPALLAATAEWIADARASDEGREGLAAMLARRAPSWAPPS